ncbi:bifunctional 3-demethylubiquinone-9 3-methyltransferase/ 2-octaprenyl-6-hydroxy phenol methylase [Streptomyces sp. S4.7]|uniref:class I SAM-dependent methyltransferase n=1 Tax=Streptomyces sp. S4.7 TaxID=2705439 RepID=UPI001398B88C|nr:class I SAM-dependent methyltransferase [Streptomyces sp. S4.7]QHY99227.1 bifunctional 3-demethylubiquinone-9 3-methyltransferase/ 2-octaprenyl-6-hydroxy phenol methylase [Streptomyces sp. S4.7]
MAAGEAREHEAEVLDSFYGTFPYPWRPMRLDRLTDPDLHAALVCQDLGDYTATRLRPDGDIWVAGCGTNQALITALRFPNARVLGTDASAEVLRVCGENARQLGVTNLSLRQEGLSQAAYHAQFDLVICTGVIHHNPDPPACLARLAEALRPDGVLELMVYNTFHRQEPMAFQGALRLLGNGRDTHAARLEMARRLADSIPLGSLLAQRLAAFDGPVEAWADMWINPCEHSYTVDTLWDMASSCGLHVEAPIADTFSESGEGGLWHLDFGDADLQESFDTLADRARWQVVNQLLLDCSPMLWFYLTPESGRRVTEAERSEAFLTTTFVRTAATRQGFMAVPDGGYRKLDRVNPFPVGRPSEAVKDVFEAVDGVRTMGHILGALGREVSPDSTHRLRMQLATSRFPFLRTVEKA